MAPITAEAFSDQGERNTSALLLAAVEDLTEQTRKAQARLDEVLQHTRSLQLGQKELAAAVARIERSRAARGPVSLVVVLVVVVAGMIFALRLLAGSFVPGVLRLADLPVEATNPGATTEATAPSASQWDEDLMEKLVGLVLLVFFMLSVTFGFKMGNPLANPKVQKNKQDKKQIAEMSKEWKLLKEKRQLLDSFSTPASCTSSTHGFSQDALGSGPIGMRQRRASAKKQNATRRAAMQAWAQDLGDLGDCAPSGQDAEQLEGDRPPTAPAS